MKGNEANQSTSWKMASLITSDIFLMFAVNTMKVLPLVDQFEWRSPGYQSIYWERYFPILKGLYLERIFVPVNLNQGLERDNLSGNL